MGERPSVGASPRRVGAAAPRAASRAAAGPGPGGADRPSAARAGTGKAAPARPGGEARRVVRAGLPQRVERRLRAVFDQPLSSYYLLMGPALLLTVLGLVMVFSASSVTDLLAGQSVTATFDRQALFAALGLPLMFIATALPVRVYRALAYPLLLCSLGLLLLVLVPGLGVSVNGNQNWLNLGGPIQLQPSEFAKLGLVLWAADLLARKEKRLRQWKHLLVPLLPGAGLMMGLVMLGGDMGTTIILAAIVLGLLWVAGAPGRLFGLILGGGAVLAALSVAARPSRLARVEGFLHPFSDPANQGFQAVHSIYALAGGGWFGLGLGASREKWGTLPEAHTDFIFAVIGEELGLAGTVAVLALLAALGYAGVRVATRTPDPFVRLAAGGVTVWLMVQAMINIGAVLGLLPIAGVPLPFISYGGSALLPTLFAVGMLVSFAKGEPGARTALLARRPGPVRRLLGQAARAGRGAAGGDRIGVGAGGRLRVGGRVKEEA